MTPGRANDPGLHEELPEGWARTTLGEVCAINPRVSFDEPPSDDLEVSFVPMAAVEEETGRLDASEIRTLASVRRGYTPFKENDVLFAKITPCMENGKIALAAGLKNGLGYGSTEFFVFRAYEGVLPRFLLYFLLQPSLRKEAERRMTGAVGQKRVPASYLSTCEFLLPPTAEQERIVRKLDAALSGLERGENAARRAQVRLRRYRAVVLESAIAGELTRDWRESRSQSEGAIETGDLLLQRLLDLRRARWEEAELRRLHATGKEPKDGKWKSRYPEPEPAETKALPELPRNWTWASLDQLLSSLRNGISEAPHEAAGLPILRISAVRAMRVDLGDRRFLPASTAEKYRDYELAEGDLLFTRYNGSRDIAGACGRVPAVAERIVHPDKLIRGIPVQRETQLSAYLEIAANSAASRRFVDAHLFTTAGQWGISGRNLRLTPIPLPPEAEQAGIVQAVEHRLAAAERLAATLERQLERGRSTRDALLRDAFAGRLVPQDPEDAAASTLLENLRALREAESRRPKVKPMPRSKAKIERRPLLDVLRETSPLTPEQLFANSGYQLEFESSECRQEIVDSFYDELRQLVGPKGPVQEERPDSRTVVLRLKR